MNSWKGLSTKEVKNILSILKEGYGYEGKLDYHFFINEKEKVFIINKAFDQRMIGMMRINSLGLYFAQYKDNHLRLSVEGSFLIGKWASNVITINDAQLKDWIEGRTITLTAEEREYAKNFTYDFVIIKHGEDYFGSGKLSKDKLEILNYFPKARRIKVE